MRNIDVPFNRPASTSSRKYAPLIGACAVHTAMTKLKSAVHTSNRVGRSPVMNFVRGSRALRHRGETIVLGGLFRRDEAILQIFDDSGARTRGRIAVSAARGRRETNEFTLLDSHAGAHVIVLTRAIVPVDPHTVERTRPPGATPRADRRRFVRPDNRSSPWSGRKSPSGHRADAGRDRATGARVAARPPNPRYVRARARDPPARPPHPPL